MYSSWSGETATVRLIGRSTGAGGGEGEMPSTLLLLRLVDRGVVEVGTTFTIAGGAGDREFGKGATEGMSTLGAGPGTTMRSL